MNRIAAKVIAFITGIFPETNGLLSVRFIFPSMPLTYLVSFFRGRPTQGVCPDPILFWKSGVAALAFLVVARENFSWFFYSRPRDR